MLKLALIGLGNIARYQIEASLQVDGIEIVGAHDIHNPNSSLLPKSTKFFETFDALIDSCKADIFLVSTPNITHFELGMNILQKDRGLLLEKPCCLNMHELETLNRMAEISGQFCAAALHSSYALDVLWLTEQLRSGSLNFGPLTSFYSGFYDDYYKDGAILPSAIGLGGSWIDSGINALSVISRLIDIKKVSVAEGRMSVIEGLPCSELQGSADFNFVDAEYFGKGIIDTNWSLGINRKRTNLYYLHENTNVMLDHSQETVIVRQGNSTVLIKNLQNQFPRLVNHYINLFQDLLQMYQTGKGNFELAYSLHRLLLDAHLFSLNL